MLGPTADHSGLQSSAVELACWRDLASDCPGTVRGISLSPSVGARRSAAAARGTQCEVSSFFPRQRSDIIGAASLTFAPDAKAAHAAPDALVDEALPSSHSCTMLPATASISKESHPIEVHA